MNISIAVSWPTHCTDIAMWHTSFSMINPSIRPVIRMSATCMNCASPATIISKVVTVHDSDVCIYGAASCVQPVSLGLLKMASPASAYVYTTSCEM